MILICTYEEVEALDAGARAILAHDADEVGVRPSHLAVAAPPGTRTRVAALLPRLGGSLTIRTLADQRSVQAAVEAIVTHFGSEMEARVTATHAAHEEAVASYFDFAYALGVLGRLQEMQAEMEALIEVLIGAAADDYLAEDFVFPD